MANVNFGKSPAELRVALDLDMTNEDDKKKSDADNKTSSFKASILIRAQTFAVRTVELHSTGGVVFFHSAFHEKSLTISSTFIVRKRTHFPTIMTTFAL